MPTAIDINETSVFKVYEDLPHWYQLSTKKTCKNILSIKSHESLKYIIKVSLHLWKLRYVRGYLVMKTGVLQKSQIEPRKKG